MNAIPRNGGIDPHVAEYIDDRIRAAKLDSLNHVEDIRALVIGSSDVLRTATKALQDEVTSRLDNQTAAINSLREAVAAITSPPQPKRKRSKNARRSV